LTGQPAVFPPKLHERDNCQVCIGLRGGVPGNENRWHGLVICDYCSCRRTPVATGQVSASDVAAHRFALSEQLQLLRRELSEVPLSTEAEHLLRQMAGFLNALGSLPVLPLSLPWTKVSDALPQPTDEIFAIGIDGKVRDISGAFLHAEESVMGHNPSANYTHWTLKPAAAGAITENTHG
jgi:hypothetical protein